jgi:hypothetical protein
VTPEAAFEGFRTAVQGDLLAAEYDSFSPDWKARQGVGEAEYRLLRDDLLDRGPFRYALYRADVEWVEVPAPDRARVLARFWGYTMDFRLRRFAYVEARADASVGVRGRLEDAHLEAIGERLTWQPDPGGGFGAWVYARFHEQIPDDLMQVVTVGHEWLIDDLVVHDGEPPDLSMN